MNRPAYPGWRALLCARLLLPIAAGAPSALAQGPDGPIPQSWMRSPTVEGPGGPAQEDEEGLFLRSRDGSAELRLGGLLRAEGRWNGAERRPQSEYDLNLVRLDFRGRFEEVFLFRVQPVLEEEDAGLQEAWVGADLFGGRALFMAGRMRVPFGLEELRTQDFIDFPRFSILHQFTPGPDAGLFLFGRSRSGRWEWNLSASNGNGGSDTTGDKDFAARVAIHPFRDDERTVEAQGLAGTLERLHVGAAFTVGKQEEEVGGETIDNAVGLPLLRYAPGVLLDGTRTRAGLDAAWHHGPFFAQAELMRIDQEMSLEGTGSDIRYNGGYLDLSYVLTGESKDFEGVRPERPFGRAGGAGAWILALRYSELHTEGELLASGLVQPETWPGRVRTLELGLNWVLSRHALVRCAWVHSDYSQEVRVNDALVDSEDALILQFQASF